MTNKQIIRAEIERRMKSISPHKGQGIVLTNTLKEHYNDLLSFIDSMPEKPKGSFSQTPNDSKNDWQNKQTVEALRTKYEKGHYDMREEMMKDAVDAKCLLLPPPDLFKVLLCPQITAKLGKGAIVKLIIVKED